MHYKKRKVILNKVNLVKLLNLKKKYNMFYFKKKFNFFFFLNKMLNSMIIKGKKSNVINVFLKLLNVILIRKNFKKSLYIFLYFLQIALKLIPCFIYINFYSKGKTILLPWLKTNKKMNKRKVVIIGVNWFKKSYKARKEKTFFLKFFSELENIRSGKSFSLEQKNNYYQNFYENKRYIRFLRNKLWI